MTLFGKKTAEQQTSDVNQAAQAHAYETAIRSISDGVMVIDDSLNIALANPAMLNIAGWGAEDATGLNYKSVLNLLDSTGQPLTDIKCPVLQVKTSNQPVESKDLMVFTKHSNKKVPVFLSVIPSGSDIVVTARDIDAELKEERERTEFVSTASHEMRTPVASIEGYLGLALNPETATIDARAQTYISKAHEAAQHLGRLFQDLLDTTKLDDKRFKIDPKLTDITALARTVFDGQQGRMAKKGLQYVFIPDQVVRGELTLAPILYAQVDQDFLREALDNLIENAAKYTPSGSVEVNVTADSANVVVSVKDSGIGIAPEDLSHLFQKFYRVDSTDTREIGGTGLGLYISKRHVEEVGGRMWAESEYGKGSTFFISVPRLDNTEAEKIRAEETHAEAIRTGAIEQFDPFGNPPAPTPQPTPAAPTPTLPTTESTAPTPAASASARPATPTNSNYYPAPTPQPAVDASAPAPAPIVPNTPTIPTEQPQTVAPTPTTLS
ncbi:MAG: PAS domain-containing protein [Candidatus Nomurabacteria bacterium]|jgi:PAS domain S-box-containing protein|nr:PAS domain-containing protein [Candidatus Nomurabacteria bacterium]